jgi:hypothetical protein
MAWRGGSAGTIATDPKGKVCARRADKDTGPGHLPSKDMQVDAARTVADLKAWRALFTDYRRPLATFETSFHAGPAYIFSRRTLNNPHYVRNAVLRKDHNQSSREMDSELALNYMTAECHGGYVTLPPNDPGPIPLLNSTALHGGLDIEYASHSTQ